MAKKLHAKKCRHLVLVLGDQLNAASSAFDDFDREHDLVWMAEVAEEATHVWTHKARIVMFLASMRHFRDQLLKKHFQVDYRELEDSSNQGTLARELAAAVKRVRPKRLILVEPGEWRVRNDLVQAARKMNIELELRPDNHFLSTPEEFAQHAQGRKQLRLEYFYRELRRKHDILMDGNTPEGGKWNYDAENRASFGKAGPKKLPKTKHFRPDATTTAVMELVEREFPDHPGDLEHFDWPVTPKQARQALDDFVEHRLADFGQYQDAMWSDEPYLYHSRLSASLNLKLISPREVIDEAVIAYRSGKAPLNSVEGFVRQILGWREYVRGIYWLFMPEYLDRNELNASQPMPAFYWSGETDMHCLSQTISQTLDFGYAHHIQRLMVTGLFALLLGVTPKQVHEWYLAVYVDAVEWVELPNSLGMSQFADGGVMASKPYVATGKYIQRMSNYCQSCQFNPAEATGETACPFTTLYWEFLSRHKKRLQGNNRMSMQLKNLERKPKAELNAIRKRAQALRNTFGADRK
ncbi:cryptochrome/photolyase family protein [Bythopirellula polymerisocia]|uniref:Deoxyribodipyrimidine photo-lyase-related protein n=1 Tax=Bythopirellula polymerisocia TaxID=2528003 RepID=A0A5C6D5M6_9BACT|nr:cryptochrome/photolyase family protein [Bythopirellula polymerisocia]TWU30526.1 Deoxyribodipyrimidine photo-lyase-related protein [Bythopirellula polymerisocia]